MDAALVYDPVTLTFDLAIDGYGLKTESGLRSAVIVSLFTDRRAESDNALPSGTTDRRGWWADPTLGSRLWLLKREKETPDLYARARHYAEEALAWLVDDGVASAVVVAVERVRAGLVGLAVTITLADRTQFQDVFNMSLGGA